MFLRHNYSPCKWRHRRARHISHLMRSWLQGETENTGRSSHQMKAVNAVLGLKVTLCTGRYPMFSPKSGTQRPSKTTQTITTHNSPNTHWRRADELISIYPRHVYIPYPLQDPLLQHSRSLKCSAWWPTDNGVTPSLTLNNLPVSSLEPSKTYLEFSSSFSICCTYQSPNLENCNLPILAPASMPASL